jgi:hypothetical protein
MMNSAATRLQGLQSLCRLGTLRHAQAQRLLLAARLEEFAAESEQVRITAQLSSLRGEEARGAVLARNQGSLAALQAAQQSGAQLRREAEAQQVLRDAADQRWQRARIERERAAQRLRAEQTRQDWLDRECRRVKARLRSTQAVASDAAAFDTAAVRRALA